MLGEDVAEGPYEPLGVESWTAQGRGGVLAVEGCCSVVQRSSELHAAPVGRVFPEVARGVAVDGWIAVAADEAVHAFPEHGVVPVLDCLIQSLRISCSGLHRGVR